VYVKVALYAGAVFAAPFMVYRLWQFVKPAASDDVQRTFVLWAIAAAFLFAAGTAFAFFLALPSAIRFLMALSQGLAAPLITVNSYLSFVLAVLVVAGLVFEIPAVCALLTRMGIITPALLRRKRKEAFFALCVFAAVMTPTTDIVNMLLFIIPMAALYEVGILVSACLYAAKPRTPAEEAYPHEG
jgi:sec-independent protein translocase protein TatC